MQPQNTIFFLCDVQTKFKPAIYGYEHVVSISNKMVGLAKLLGIPVICTTQNAKALGPIDPSIDLPSLGPLLLGNFDKTLFSMLTPEVKQLLCAHPQRTNIVLFGIESHVCILQTALSLLSLSPPPTVYIPADAVSSCNAFEVRIALTRLRTLGAQVSTSESLAFQLMGDAGDPGFKEFSKWVKEWKDGTKRGGEGLLGSGTDLKSAL